MTTSSTPSPQAVRDRQIQLLALGLFPNAANWQIGNQAILSNESVDCSSDEHFDRIMQTIDKFIEDLF